jgi:hypothetical protein
MIVFNDVYISLTLKSRLLALLSTANSPTPGNMSIYPSLHLGVGKLLAYVSLYIVLIKSELLRNELSNITKFASWNGFSKRLTTKLLESFTPKQPAKFVTLWNTTNANAFLSILKILRKTTSKFCCLQIYLSQLLTFLC